MRPIHLDPSCHFVSMKSAESDGIDFEVASRHFKECKRCRDYHKMVLAAQTFVAGLGDPVMPKAGLLEVKAPHNWRSPWQRRLLDSGGMEPPVTVFLAGSIEMGGAEKWQEKLVGSMEGLDVILLNPRRDDWDDTWVQSIANPKFKEQVNWELDGIESADLVAMYFSPGTKSPVTLLEFGLVVAGDAHSVEHASRLLVACPKEYWRRGNLEVTCDRFGIPLLSSLDELSARLREVVQKAIGRNKGRKR